MTKTYTFKQFALGEKSIVEQLVDFLNENNLEFTDINVVVNTPSLLQILYKTENVSVDDNQ